MEKLVGLVVCFGTTNNPERGSAFLCFVILTQEKFQQKMEKIWKKHSFDSARLASTVVVAGWQFLFERQSAPFKTISIIIQVPPFLQSRLRKNRPPLSPPFVGLCSKGPEFPGIFAIREAHRLLGLWVPR
jgi:hypothetical protein